MSERRRIALAAALLVLLPFCGVREPGLEVALDFRGEPTGTSGTLTLAQVELLPCPDVDPRTAIRTLFSPAVARAHDPMPTGEVMTLTFPSPEGALVLQPAPGAYCDVRVTASGLTTATGTSAARELVLRLVDETGSPTRAILDRAPHRSEVRVQLGSFDASDAPDHALGRVLDAATATLITN